MPRDVITSPRFHKVKAPLSHAARIGNVLFVSGIPGYFGDRQLAAGDFTAQFRQAMENLKVILEEAGTNLGNVAKVNVILTRQSDFWPMNELYREYFGDAAYPARTTIIAGLAVPEMLLEIEAVAAI